MRRTALFTSLAIAGLLAMAIAATAAFAGRGGTPANPAWQYANSSLSSNGQTLSVSFKEVGLGSQYLSDLITLSATVSSDWGCFTKGPISNHPAAENKEGPGTVSNTELFPVRNGNVVGTISLSISPALTCPPGQRLRLISASYTNITVHGAAGTFAATPSSLFYP